VIPWQLGVAAALFGFFVGLLVGSLLARLLD